MIIYPNIYLAHFLLDGRQQSRPHTASGNGLVPIDIWLSFWCQSWPSRRYSIFYVSGTCQIRVICIFGTAEMLPILKIGFNGRNICHQLNLVDDAEKASQLGFAVLGSLLVFVADASGRAWYKSNRIHLGFDSMWVGVVLILIYGYMIILDVTRKFQYIHRHHKHSWVHFNFNKYFKHCLLSASVLTIPET